MAQPTLATPVARAGRLRAALVRRRAAVHELTWARMLLASAMVAFAAFYIVHLAMLHDRFWTTGYDLGIFDQATWLVANGKTFITIRGLTFWGHHVNPGLLLFAPLYRLGAGPRVLNATMVVAYTMGAWPVFRIAMHHLRNEWVAVGLAVAYLLQTGGQWVLHETFHPEVLAIAPMLYAYLAVLEGRWRAYWLWLLLAASWKEDISITIAMVGIVLLLRGHRKQGAITFVAAAGYYYFCTKILIPHYTAAGPFYSEFLGNLGSTPWQLARNAVVHPTRFTDQFQEAHWYRYPRDLAQPYAFTSFFSWPGLLIALPQTVLNLLTRHSYAWSIRWHYVSMPAFGFTVAAIEGVANIKRLLLRWRRSVQFATRWFLESIAVVIVLCAVVMSAMWAPSYGWRYDDPGVWPLATSQHQQVLRAAVALVPDSAVVSTSYNFSTHLAHREFVYEFPNPWRNSYWGVDQRLPDGRVVAWPPARDPATIEWIAVDKGTLGKDSLVLLGTVLAEPKWEIVFDQESVVVARRRS